MLTNILIIALTLLNIGLSFFIIQLLKPGKVKRLQNYSKVVGMTLDLDETELKISE